MFCDFCIVEHFLIYELLTCQNNSDFGMPAFSMPLVVMNCNSAIFVSSEPLRSISMIYYYREFIESSVLVTADCHCDAFITNGTHRFGADLSASKIFLFINYPVIS